jgi:hypothetical protein
VQPEIQAAQSAFSVSKFLSEIFTEPACGSARQKLQYQCIQSDHTALQVSVLEVCQDEDYYIDL